MSDSSISHTVAEPETRTDFWLKPRRLTAWPQGTAACGGPKPVSVMSLWPGLDDEPDEPEREPEKPEEQPSRWKNTPLGASADPRDDQPPDSLSQYDLWTSSAETLYLLMRVLERYKENGGKLGRPIVQRHLRAARDLLTRYIQQGEREQQKHSA